MLDAFKDSIYYLWFSDLSDGLIDKVIEWIECLPQSERIKRSCPRIYEKFIILSIAKWLTDNAVTESGDPPTPTVPPLDSNLASFVKRDTVRDVTREYYEPKVQPCNDCKDSPYGKLKIDIEALVDVCNKANTPVLAGSNLGGLVEPLGGCTKDEYR